MTFIDITAGNPSSGLIAGYSILCVVSILCTIWAVNIGRRHQYKSFFSVRVLFPLGIIILALENAALAASGLIYDNIMERGEENFDGNAFIEAVFVLQTFEVPILLIVVFEITYLVHKRRSVNFCGMYFDEGVRVKNTAFMSFMLRNSIRTLAIVLLVMGLIVNFNVLTAQDPLAGRAGWWSLAADDWDNVHLLLSLIPTAVLTLVSFYLSIMLWRYGTESAMVVHSSMCNPWFYSFFGTLAMALGQLFGENLYTVMSNAGVLVFIITILLVMKEADKDIIATNDVACFLVQVAQKGDQVRVAPSLLSPPLQLQNDANFQQEEGGDKRDDYDVENGRAISADNDDTTPINEENIQTSSNEMENVQVVHDKTSIATDEVVSRVEEDTEDKKGDNQMESNQNADTPSSSENERSNDIDGDQNAPHESSMKSASIDLAANAGLEEVTHPTPDPGRDPTNVHTAESTPTSPGSILAEHGSTVDAKECDTNTQ